MTATNTKKTRRSEHVEQREFVSWFRKTFDGVRIFAIPNGEARSKSVGLRLAAEGVSKGVPDLFVPEWLWWCEMKQADGGTVSKEQKDWHEYLRWCGYNVSVCHGIEEAQEEARRLYAARHP